MLASLGTQVAGEPFKKVKQLIQQLIERLLAESAAEATKKGFCDEEVGKATQNRDWRFNDVKKLTAELGVLIAKRVSLEVEIPTLEAEIASARDALNQSTVLRADERTQNLATVRTAKEGLTAVKEAISILQAFYRSAARMPSLVQASPVDEDTSGPGFSGKYRGQQESSTGIIGLLEVIEADFARTVRLTEQSEAQAHADFVRFDRTAKADIAGKEMALDLANQDLVTTTNAITQKTTDLGTAQSLLDDALRILESLKPICIDTAMTYAERTAKREEEIAALKQALCYLDPDGVEPSCQGAGSF